MPLHRSRLSGLGRLCLQGYVWLPRQDSKNPAGFAEPGEEESTSTRMCSITKWGICSAQAQLSPVQLSWWGSIPTTRLGWLCPSSRSGTFSSCTLRGAQPSGMVIRLHEWVSRCQLERGNVSMAFQK